MFSVFSAARANEHHNGAYFLSNIKYRNSINNYVWSITQTARNTLLVAGREGVMEYNSEEWINIQIPDLALCLLSSEGDDRIYTGGRNHVGYLQLNKFGQYAYHSIIEGNENRGIFSKILETDAGVYFYSTQKVLFYNPTDNTVSLLEKTDSTAKFIGSFMHNNQLYLNVLNKGVFIVDNNKLSKASQFEKLNDLALVFYCQIDAKTTVIGGQNGKLFLLNDEGLKSFAIEAEEFLQQDIITDGVLFSNSKIAISFRNSGLIILDCNTGKISDVIDSEGGLPDNNAMALYAPDQQTLWVAHSNGLSHLDVSLPIRNYSSYAGLEGSIITSNFWNNQLYIATSDGVFILDSISNYDTREAVKKIPVIRNSNADRISNIATVDYSNSPMETDKFETENKEEQKKSRRGLFKRLFNNKEEPSNTESQSSGSKTIPETPPKNIQEQEFEYFQYKQLVLKSKHYGFSLVGELRERCYKLISLENQLLAVTNSSIYSIDANKHVTEIFKGSNILDVAYSNSNNGIFIITNKGVTEGKWNANRWSFKLMMESDINFNITSLAEISDESFLVALNNQLVKADINTGELIDIPLINPYSESVTIKQVNELVYVLVGTTLYQLNKEGTGLKKEQLTEDASVALAFLKQPNQFCIKTSQNSYQYFGSLNISYRAMSALKIFDDLKDIHIDRNENIWLINSSDEIYRINSSAFASYNLPCDIYLGKIQTPNGTLLPGDNFKLKYVDNSLTFSFVSPSTLKLNSSQYQYVIEGLMDDWSEWSNNSEFTIPYFPPGNYQLKYRARNILDELSAEGSLKFKILPPFWQTIYFYALVLFTVAFGLYYWQKFRVKKLIRDKELLQQKINERTEELQEKNDAITDSINYAGKIQKALLPPSEKLSTLIDEHFVYYKPKDIISGDFYLAVKRKRYTVIIAADCTGHGVPGAFMSMLGMAYINDILAAADGHITAAEILNALRNKIITLLHQHNTDSRDGMDMVVLLFDRKKNNVQYAGAHNPLYRLVPKKYELSEADKKLLTNENNQFYFLQYKANRFQVGNSKKSHIDFTNHVINYEPEERFYIFSDGYADQFGGEETRKFMYGNFRRLLLENANKPMNEQRRILSATIKDWKKDNPQTDDILVIGLKP